MTLPEEFKIDLGIHHISYRCEIIETLLVSHDFVYDAEKQRFENDEKYAPMYVSLRKDGIRLGSDLVLFESIDLPSISGTDFMVRCADKRISQMVPKSEKVVDLPFVRKYIESEFGAAELERFNHALKWRN